jgi:hypothetical protein
MRSSPGRHHSVDEVLSRSNAKLEAWQVRALFLGAQTSTNLRLGPHHLLEHIFGPEPVLGESVDDVNASLGPLMKLWNDLVTEHRSGHVRLSRMPLPETPSVAQLDAFAERRAEEITWFTRGIDAGGDDPMEFGPVGEQLLHKLGEAGAFLEACRTLLAKTPAQTQMTLRESRQTLEELTSAVEGLAGDLMTISDRVRKHAIEVYQGISGGVTDDGVSVRRPVEVGRNEPCPCGSGRKWKRCCGSPTSTQ